MTIAVSLVNPDEPAEHALADAVVDPAAAGYHHFVSVQQWTARFALPIAVQQRTASWLRRGGLRVEWTSRAGDLMTASGTVAQLERLLRVDLGEYRSGPTTFLANDVGPTVPVGLPVAGVIGLNDLQRFVPATPLRAHPAVGAFSGVIDVKSLWKTYEATAADTGQGVGMGVFMAGNTDPVVGSLRVFEQQEHLPRIPVRVVRTEPGKPDEFGTNGGGGEWMLDTQAATGMAPGVAEVDLYAAKSLADADTVAEIAYWANDPEGPPIMNASFGECEEFPLSAEIGKASSGIGVENLVQDAVERSLMQAFAEGRTLFASAGDTGSSCPVVSLPLVGGGNGQLNQVRACPGLPRGQWVGDRGGRHCAQPGQGRCAE